jgi:hypothetical protein
MVISSAPICKEHTIKANGYTDVNATVSLHPRLDVNMNLTRDEGVCEDVGC